jgi:hypothetical protein
VAGLVIVAGELVFWVSHRPESSAIVEHADPVIWIADPILSYLARREGLPRWMLRACRLRLPEEPVPHWELLGPLQASPNGFAFAAEDSWPRSRLTSMITRWHGVVLIIAPPPPCPTLAPLVQAPQSLVYRVTGRAPSRDAGTPGPTWEARWPD